MSVYWNGQLLPQFPVTGATHSFVNGLTSMQTNTMHQVPTLVFLCYSAIKLCYAYFKTI